MKATNKTQGIEVHYMDDGFHLHGEHLYLFTDEHGHHPVEAMDVTTHLVTEWLDTTGRDDLAICEEAYTMMQNGISEFTGKASVSEGLRVRSMMMGDVVAIQTNNNGPKRQYVVAAFGFERIA